MPANVLRIHLAENQDQQRWDAYVADHPDASPYHFFAWKRAVEDAYGHRCFYYLAEEHGRLVGILPMVHLHLPGLVNELCALPYCDVGACLSDTDLVHDGLLTEALNLKKQLGSNRLTLRGPLRDTVVQRASFQVEATGKVRMLLPLPGSAAALFAGFKSKLRSQIRKAEKNGIVFSWRTLGDMDDLYHVFARNMRELGSPVHGKEWLRQVLSHYSGRCKIGVVRFASTTVGMGILLQGAKGVSIPWASTLREYNHLGPNMLLYWNFLQFSAEHGFAFFDFGRSTEEEGTYRFKKQWGAEPEPLTWYRDQSGPENCPAPTRPTNGRNLLATLWRNLPLPVANTLGPHVRKYISL